MNEWDHYAALYQDDVLVRRAISVAFTGVTEKTADSAIRFVELAVGNANTAIAVRHLVDLKRDLLVRFKLPKYEENDQ